MCSIMYSTHLAVRVAHLDEVEQGARVVNTHWLLGLLEPNTARAGLQCKLAVGGRGAWLGVSEEQVV